MTGVVINMLGQVKPTGAEVTRAIGDFLAREFWVDDYVEADDEDSSPAIVRARDAAIAAGGGFLVFTAGTEYAISETIEIGDGTDTPGNDGFSTYAGIGLKGSCPGSGIGPFNPLDSASLLSSVAGAAILINGPILSYWIEDLYIAFDTDSTDAIGLDIIEGQYGGGDRITIVDCPGRAMRTTTRGNNNTTRSKFGTVRIWMSDDFADAIGLECTGEVGSDTAFVSIDHLSVTPSLDTQKPLVFGYCDSVKIGFLEVNPIGCQAITYDFSVSSNFPNANVIVACDIYDNTVGKVGSPSVLVVNAPNRIGFFSQTNGAVLPSVDGLTIERLRLCGDQSFYVSTTGNDTTGTGTTGNPWATIQHAYDVLASAYDLNGHTATIQLKDGTHTNGLSATIPGVNGQVVLSGNSGTPGSTVINTVGECVSVANKVRLTVKNCLLTSGAGCIVSDDADVSFQNIVFGSAGAAHLLAKRDGVLRAAGNYFANGNAVDHAKASSGGRIVLDGVTMTVLTNIAVSGVFALATIGGSIEAVSTTFTLTGSVTGTRYSATLNGVINSGGGGASYFPGNAGGATATGGQYA